MSGSGWVLRESTSSDSASSDGSPRRARPGCPRDADDVAEEDVDLARLRRLADHLDPARAVDDVEEDELAHVAPRHRPAGDPAVVSADCPASSGSHSSRTAAISSRSGKRFAGA